MRQRLFKKYFFAAAFIVVFSLGVMMMILSFAFSNYIAENKYSSLKKSCIGVGEFTSGISGDEYRENGEESVYLIIKSLATLPELDIYITAPDGTVERYGYDGGHSATNSQT